MNCPAEKLDTMVCASWLLIELLPFPLPELLLPELPPPLPDLLLPDPELLALETRAATGRTTRRLR